MKTIDVKMQPLQLRLVKVVVEGKEPGLLMDRFPPEVQKQILDKQIGKNKPVKKNRDLKKEVMNAVHKTSTGKVGFPAHGFKKGMIESTSFCGNKDFSKKLVSGAVNIINVVDGLVLLKFKKQTVLEHSIGHNVKFSPLFKGWTCELLLEYDENNISPQDIITLLNYAGHYQGVGSWRPKGKDGGTGSYGRYAVKIKTDNKVK